MKDGLTQVKELKDKIHEQYIEIQELNKRVEDLKTINEEHQILNGMLRKENDRLNTIINELEKWLEEQHQFIIEIPAYTKEISIEHKTMEICYENVLEKLQELKGSDSNE